MQTKKAERAKVVLFGLSNSKGDTKKFVIIYKEQFNKMVNLKPEPKEVVKKIKYTKSNSLNQTLSSVKIPKQNLINEKDIKKAIKKTEEKFPNLEVVLIALPMHGCDIIMAVNPNFIKLKKQICKFNFIKLKTKRRILK